MEMRLTFDLDKPGDLEKYNKIARIIHGWEQLTSMAVNQKPAVDEYTGFLSRINNNSIRLIEIMHKKKNSTIESLAMSLGVGRLAIRSILMNLGRVSKSCKWSPLSMTTMHGVNIYNLKPEVLPLRYVIDDLMKLRASTKSKK